MAEESKKLYVEIISPQGCHFRGEVENCYFRTPVGEMGVLPGHCDFLVKVEKGVIQLDKDKNGRIFGIDKGVAYKLGNPLVFVLESCEIVE